MESIIQCPTIASMCFVRMGVRDIGRRSDSIDLGGEALGVGGYVR